MASIGGNEPSFTRFTNWAMTVASGVAVAGVVAMVAFAWNSNGTLNRIESRLEQQDRRDQEQDRWIDYFRTRIDGRRTQATRLRGADGDE